MEVTPSRVCSFNVGYTGTSYGYYPVWVEEPGQSALIDFIDDIVVPGTYKTFIENPDTDPITVEGYISVEKR